MQPTQDPAQDTAHQPAEAAPAEGAAPTSASEQDVLDFAQKIFEYARTGDTEGLRPMLQRGLPPNMSNHKGDTLLMLAAYHGHLETARLLLEVGANPDKYNDMAQTPLGATAFKGYLPMVELLLEHKALPDFAPPGGKTPLMFAAMFNRTAIVDVLLAQGVSMETVSSDGMTALQLAQKMGAEDTAAQLEKREHRRG